MDDICKACYLFWIYPTYTTAIGKVIYGKENFNLAPITRCRNKLVESGYLVEEVGRLLQRRSFKSSAKPYLEYLEREMGKSRIDMGETERKCIEAIFDSMWLREFFKPEYLLSGDSYPLTEISVEKNGRIRVENPVEIVATILNEIATLSDMLEGYVEFRRPTAEEVIRVGLDRLAEENRMDFREYYAKLFIDGLVPFSYLELNRNLLLIPESVAAVLKRGGRGAHTLHTQGPKLLEEDLAEKIKSIPELAELEKVFGIPECVLEYGRRTLRKVLREKGREWLLKPMQK